MAKKITDNTPIQNFEDPWGGTYQSGANAGKEWGKTRSEVERVIKEKVEELEEANSIQILNKNISYLQSLATQWWILNNKWRTTTSNYSARRIYITSYRGLALNVKPQSGKSCVIAFMKAWGKKADNKGTYAVSEYCDGESLMTISSNASITIPDDAVYLYILYLENGINILPASIEITDKIRNVVENTSTAVSDLDERTNNLESLGIDERLSTIEGEANIETVLFSKDTEWITEQSARYPITDSNKWNSTNYGSSIRIAATSYRGKVLTVVPQEGYGIQVAFVKEWSPTTVSSATNVSFCDDWPEKVKSDTLFSAVIPDDAAYIYIGRYNPKGTYCVPQSVTIKDVKSVKTVVENMSTAVSDLNERTSSLESLGIDERLSTIEGEANIETVLYQKDTEEISAPAVQYPITDANKWNSTNYGDSFRIAATSYRGKVLTVVPQEGYKVEVAFVKAWAPSSVSSATAVSFCDDWPEKVKSSTAFSAVIPDDALYIYIGRNRSKGTYCVPQSVTIKDVKSVKETVVESLSTMPVVYVDPANGSDENSGTSGNPVATVAAAMDKGSATMTIILSGTGCAPIDLSPWEGKKQHVTIRGWKDVRRIINAGQTLSGLTAYSGYTDVYTWTPGEGESLPSGTSLWLWQHQIPDADTEILKPERHPLQRGRQYRRLSTCIKHASSLDALLSAEKPMWYADSDTLYIRAVAGSDVSANPIVIPSANPGIKCPSTFGITIVNIESWYGHIMVNNAYSFKASDCAARYTQGAGAWRIDDGIDAMLIRCEADSNTMPNTTTGDGFNIHPTSGSNINAKGGTHTLIDCWAHDNNDDGYSDHGRSEGTIIGGLYEYNVKSGLAPAVGSQDTIYHAVCRNQNAGILYTGKPESSEGGMGGQVECFGCICHDNINNYKVQGANTDSPEPNRMILNQCISRNASNAALYVDTNCFIHARDCSDSGSTKLKETHGGASNAWITIDNGTIIT